MPETQLATALAQFGVAGLIGWMWLAERRAAATRDRQLAEAHDRLTRRHSELAALLKALDRNSRALAALESGQRRLADILDRVLIPHPAPPRTATTAPDVTERPDDPPSADPPPRRHPRVATLGGTLPDPRRAASPSS